VVTLSVAVAATFVSTTVANKDGGWDEAGVGLMVGTLVLTVVVVAFAPSPPKGDVTDVQLRRFRRWACWTHWLMVIQVVASSLSVVAVVLAQRPEWH
jgi:hypothetical protein